MNIPSKVIEKLNTELEESKGVLEGTSYRIWKVKDVGTSHKSLARARKFLANYELTAYLTYDYHMVVTPSVSNRIIEIVNSVLLTAGQIEPRTPCRTWPVDCEPDDLDDMLGKVRIFLNDFPVFAYKSGTNWRNDPYFVGYDSISVAPTTNKFDILRFEQIDGGYSGLSTEDIIRELVELDKRYKFDIIGGPAVIQLERPLKGSELQEFEKWLFDFCPDPFDNTETDLSRGRIGLWWD